MYNLLEYSNNYSETSVRLWQYYRHEPSLNNPGTYIDFLAGNNTSSSFKFKQKFYRPSHA